MAVRSLHAQTRTIRSRVWLPRHWASATDYLVYYTSTDVIRHRTQYVLSFQDGSLIPWNVENIRSFPINPDVVMTSWDHEKSLSSDVVVTTEASGFTTGKVAIAIDKLKILVHENII